MRFAGRRIVVGVTGSIAAYKAPLLVRELVREGADVRVVVSPTATHFVAPGALRTFAPTVLELFPAEFPGTWHIEWARWAEAMLIAPCSAATLGKLAAGIPDTAPTLVACALPATTPLVLAPAMDSEMWEHPATVGAVAQLRRRGVWIVPPAYGELASGSVGVGRLPELESILGTLEAALLLGVQQPLHRWDGLRVLVTAGPTRERLDPVRFLSNFSSGRMGYALAEAARDRGAEVVLVSGPTALPQPPGVEFVRVESAREMAAAVLERADTADVLCMVAAVVDFAPRSSSPTKLHKSGQGTMLLELETTPDILAAVAQQRRPGQLLVGFALETDSEWESAQRKLHEKGCDLVVLNSLRWGAAGFESPFNTIAVLSRQGYVRMFPPRSKRVCAEWILQCVQELRSPDAGSGGQAR
jgi:phosphopantothenoylcysteine decarboxylase/phosphopantothenate--cysteine ligase